MRISRSDHMYIHIYIYICLSPGDGAKAEVGRRVKAGRAGSREDLNACTSLGKPILLTQRLVFPQENNKNKSKTNNIK